MSRKIKICMNGVDTIVRDGTCICDLVKKIPHKGEHPAVGALVDNHVVGLDYKLKSPSNVETIDISRREGMDIYRRSVSTILYAAIADIDPKARVIVGQSISNGYFFEVNGVNIDEDFILTVESKMRRTVDGNFTLERKWIAIEEAVDIFRERGADDKVKLIRQMKRSEIPVVTLGKYMGIGFGPVAHHTKLLSLFSLSAYEHGIVLVFPDENGKLHDVDKSQPKLFSAYLESKRWNELIGIENVGDINEHCMGRAAAELVGMAEVLHEKKIAAIAEEITSRKSIRVVFIAGPSSSGKTTFSKRLRIHLKTLGIHPIVLSMDSYYLDREQTPKHADGQYDFEAPDALDVKLFDDHIKRILNGEGVHVPIYSFPRGKRTVGRFLPLKLGNGEILIIEGIHGLNDIFTGVVPDENKFRIYVSALTQLCLDDHNRIFTTDARLCRRIVRDRLFRGTAAAETIEGWPSVKAGESQYIFPFQEHSDVMFNSALPYEHSLLKIYAERFLAEVPREHPSFIEAYRLSKFFSYFIPIMSSEVPRTSILREFIGGSAFRY